MSCWLDTNSSHSIWWDTSSRKALGNPEFWLCVPMGQDGVKMVNKTAAPNLYLFDLKHILHNHFGNWTCRVCGNLEVDICVICALYQKLLLCIPEMQPEFRGFSELTRLSRCFEQRVLLPD
jgi:hypothetical protein